jgi:hypothetical protein
VGAVKAPTIQRSYCPRNEAESPAGAFWARARPRLNQRGKSPYPGSGLIAMQTPTVGQVRCFRTMTVLGVGSEGGGVVTMRATTEPKADRPSQTFATDHAHGFVSQNAAPRPRIPLNQKRPPNGGRFYDARQTSTPSRSRRPRAIGKFRWTARAPEGGFV